MSHPVAVARRIPPGDKDTSAAKRLSRLLAIVRMIEAEPGAWTRRRLARWAGVSERQMDHDLRAIREAGVDLRRLGGGYVIEE